MLDQQEEQLEKERTEYVRRLRLRTIRRIVVWSVCGIALAVVVAARIVYPKIQRGAQHRAAMVSTTTTPSHNATDKGLALMQQAHQQLKNNKPQEAVNLLRQVVTLIPNHVPAHLHLGMLLGDQGRMAEAMEHYRVVLRHKDNDPIALNNLADILATDPDDKLRDGHLAITLANRGCETAQHRSPILLSTLAAAYAETGQYSKAAQLAREAIELANHQEMPQVAKLITLQLESHEREVPFRKRLNVKIAVSYADNTSSPQQPGSSGKESRSLSPLEEQLQ